MPIKDYMQIGAFAVRRVRGKLEAVLMLRGGLIYASTLHAAVRSGIGIASATGRNVRSGERETVTAELSVAHRFQRWRSGDIQSRWS